MKHFTYAIVNSEGKIYKGYTTDIEKRLSYHNKNLGNWTKQKGPWKIIYTASFDSRSEALNREKFLKSGVGRNFLKNLPGCSAVG